jgi:hypothetical protein
MRGFTQEIATVNGSQSDPTQQANARLIAAAPELLEALERAVKDELGDNWRDSASAAIDKARNGSNEKL